MSTFYVFVHLPKTGGTGIRVAAARQLGHDRILYDYGRRDRLTSEVVREWIYERKEPGGLAAALRELGNYRFLTGHFPVTRYREHFPEARFITWMREPRQRVLSAYRHFRRNNGFEGSLEDFYRMPEHQNVQARFMASDPGLFDFVGILEHHRASLAALARATGLTLPDHPANVAPEEERTLDLQLTDWEGISRVNQADIALYDRVLAQLASTA